MTIAARRLEFPLRLSLPGLMNLSLAVTTLLSGEIKDTFGWRAVGYLFFGLSAFAAVVALLVNLTNGCFWGRLNWSTARLKHEEAQERLRRRFAFEIHQSPFDKAQVSEEIGDDVTRSPFFMRLSRSFSDRRRQAPPLYQGEAEDAD
jgi:hypothetical protein